MTTRKERRETPLFSFFLDRPSFRLLLSILSLKIDGGGYFKVVDLSQNQPKKSFSRRVTQKNVLRFLYIGINYSE